MPCAKCGHDKSTPVAFGGKLYCISCSVVILEEESEREDLFRQIRADLKSAGDEKKAIEGIIMLLVEDYQGLIKQRDDIDRNIAEADKRREDINKKIEEIKGRMHEQEDLKGWNSNRIDKMESDLKRLGEK